MHKNVTSFLKLSSPTLSLRQVKLVLLCALFIFPLYSAKEFRALDETINQKTKISLKKDAARLAIRSTCEQNNCDFKTLDIDISDKRIEEIYNALVSFHTADLPVAQLINKTHKIHTANNPNIDRISIIYDNKLSWIKGNQGNYNVENTSLKTFIDKYKFEIIDHKEWDKESNIIILSTANYINIAGLEQRILKIGGVKGVNPLKINKSIKDIHLRNTENGMLFKFLYKNDAWEFLIDNSLQVDYLGEKSH